MLYKSKWAAKTALFSLLPWVAMATPPSDSKHNFYCGEELAQAKNLQNIVPTLYSIVSGPVGAKHDWELLRKLFSSDANITPVFHDANHPVIKPLKVDDFISLNKELFENQSFFETEVASQIISVGHMATILSLYESRETPEAEPYSTGVNSFQLLNDGRRWCVISVTWDSDKGGHLMPKNFDSNAGWQF